jgi:haloalkane dehalogenase
MVLEQNLFVEQLLPSSILRKLTEEELAEYRRPLLTPGEARRPTLSWPRQLPIAGEPTEICALVERYAAFMNQPHSEAVRQCRARAGIVLASRPRYPQVYASVHTSEERRACCSSDRRSTIAALTCEAG